MTPSRVPMPGQISSRNNKVTMITEAVTAEAAAAAPAAAAAAAGPTTTNF